MKRPGLLLLRICELVDRGMATMVESPERRNRSHHAPKSKPYLSGFAQDGAIVQVLEEFLDPGLGVLEDRVEPAGEHALLGFL